MKCVCSSQWQVCLSTALGTLLACSPWAHAEEKKAENPLEGWPEGAREVLIVSTADGTEQPSIYRPADTNAPAPLLVGLHTWSFTYLQKGGKNYAQWCVKHGWHFIHPNFRGRLGTPQATGSELVVQDILDAVEYAKKNGNVDTTRIYLAGLSGGGYTSMLMAGRAPEVWAGVSAWVPITDLKAWYEEGKFLGPLKNACGGIPGDSPEVDKQYRQRSPVTHLHRAIDLPLDINHGIRDATVPCSHSLRAFNIVAKPEDRIADEDVRYFADKMEVPPHLKGEWKDPDYNPKILFRRESGNARVTIFDGGHGMNKPAALTWLAKQKRNQGATPAAGE